MIKMYFNLLFSKTAKTYPGILHNVILLVAQQDVTLVFKKGNTNLAENYSSVSLNCNFGLMQVNGTYL